MIGIGLRWSLLAGTDKGGCNWTAMEVLTEIGNVNVVVIILSSGSGKVEKGSFGAGGSATGFGSKEGRH